MWPDDCVATALVQNEWLEQEQVHNMAEMDRKSALIENLNKHLNGEIHSVPELSYRKENLFSLYMIECHCLSENTDCDDIKFDWAVS